MRETKIGRFLRPSHKVGSLISYWILPTSGMPVTLTTMKHITYLETCTDSKKSLFKVFDDGIQEQFHEKYDKATFSGKNISKPTMYMWAELADNDEDFREEFNRVFNNTDVN